MGKITISEELIRRFRKIAGKQQAFDGQNWTDEMTMYHILDKYEEYMDTRKEREVQKLREGEEVQEVQKPPKRSKRKK